VIVIFAFILLLLGQRPHDNEEFGIMDSIWSNLNLMLDPGLLSDTSANWVLRIYFLVVTIIGVVVFSTLIGLVSNGILTKLEDLRKGRSFVIEEDHTIILGWSSKIFTIISELILANENLREGVIVILAQKD
jgi:ion channel POLLUX/CASTOR